MHAFSLNNSDASTVQRVRATTEAIERAKVFNNGGWCVQHVGGEVVRCHNYATARHIAKTANKKADEFFAEIERILKDVKWTKEVA